MVSRLIERLTLGVTVGVVCALVIIVLIFIVAAIFNLEIEDAQYLLVLLIGGGVLGAVWSLLPLDELD